MSERDYFRLQDLRQALENLNDIDDSDATVAVSTLRDWIDNGGDTSTRSYPIQAGIELRVEWERTNTEARGTAVISIPVGEPDRIEDEDGTVIDSADGQCAPWRDFLLSLNGRYAKEDGTVIYIEER